MMINRYTNLVIIFLALWACARQTSPNGGPKDLTPPTLTRSSPKNNEINFKGKTITLTFDEPIKLKDPKEEIIIAPSPGKEINFTAKQNRITIELKSPLKDSTTYSMTFREGIQDITESNPTDDLKLAFSTGPTIDSLHITGRITDALIEKIPQKITVAIFQSDTFDIFKHSPVYFTKTDKQGRFILNNLKPGSYRIYAFEDKNKNLKLETKTEKFGFTPGHLQLDANNDSLQIALVSLDSRPIRLSNIRHSEKISRVKFNKFLTAYSAKPQGQYLLNTFGDDQSEIKFYHSDMADSIPVDLEVTDSLNQTLDTLIYIKKGTGGTVPEKFKLTIDQAALDLETSSFKAVLNMNKPLRQISYDTIFLQIDSVTQIPLLKSDLHYDTTFNQITATRSIDPTVMSSMPSAINFYIGDGTFISIDGDTTKHAQKFITKQATEESAILFLEIQTQKKYYLVQLLTPDYKIVAMSANIPNITFKNITPGEYKIRIIEDDNNNSKWDPGNILKDIPPERTFFYRNNDGKFQFPLRANWEVGPYQINF